MTQRKRSPERKSPSPAAVTETSFLPKSQYTPISHAGPRPPVSTRDFTPHKLLKEFSRLSKSQLNSNTTEASSLVDSDHPLPLLDLDVHNQNPFIESLSVSTIIHGSEEDSTLDMDHLESDGCYEIQNVQDQDDLGNESYQVGETYDDYELEELDRPKDEDTVGSLQDEVPPTLLVEDSSSNGQDSPISVPRSFSTPIPEIPHYSSAKGCFSFDPAFSPDIQSNPQLNAEWHRILDLVNSISVYSKHTSTLSVLESLSSSDDLYISLRQVLLELKTVMRDHVQQESEKQSQMTANLNQLEQDIASMTKNKDQSKIDLDIILLEIKQEQARIYDTDKKIDELKQFETKLRADILAHENICDDVSAREKLLQLQCDTAKSVHAKANLPITLYERLQVIMKAVCKHCSMLAIMFFFVVMVEACVVYYMFKVRHQTNIMNPEFRDSSRDIEGGMMVTNFPGIWIIPVFDGLISQVAWIFDFLWVKNAEETVFTF
ncbi:hypothetical protein QVD99_007240 [Batrachochytrium dendrobatidis]|nr:hypothetical protein QVD99_007240 [Batrachochytrium dendrobatidis]